MSPVGSLPLTAYLSRIKNAAILYLPHGAREEPRCRSLEVALISLTVSSREFWSHP